MWYTHICHTPHTLNLCDTPHIPGCAHPTLLVAFRHVLPPHTRMWYPHVCCTPTYPDPMWYPHIWGTPTCPNPHICDFELHTSELMNHKQIENTYI